MSQPGSHRSLGLSAGSKPLLSVLRVALVWQILMTKEGHTHVQILFNSNSVRYMQGLCVRHRTQRLKLLHAGRDTSRVLLQICERVMTTDNSATLRHYNHTEAHPSSTPGQFYREQGHFFFFKKNGCSFMES